MLVRSLVAMKSVGGGDDDDGGILVLLVGWLSLHYLYRVCHHQYQYFYQFHRLSVLSTHSGYHVRTILCLCGWFFGIFVKLIEILSHRDMVGVNSQADRDC